MWGVSQDRIERGRARDGWDVPKANSKGLAKWALGPRDLPTQASVSILDPELPQGHIILPAGASANPPSSRWGLGPKNNTMMDGSHTGTGSAWGLRPFPVLHALGHPGARGLPPQSPTMPQVSKRICSLQ